MKKSLHQFILACCLCAPFFGQAQTAQVHIAGSDYPVLFADTNLPFAIRQRIANDMNFVFSPAASFREARGGGGDMVDVTIPIPGGGTSTNSHENWSGIFKPSERHSFFPKAEEWDNTVFMVDYNNEQSVRVSTNASGRYLQALALVDVHSNAVAQVSNFVAQVNSPGLLSQPMQVIRDMYHARPWPQDGDDTLTDEEALKFLTGITKVYKCPGFSALHFSVERRPEIGNAEVLMTWIGLIDKSPTPQRRIPNFGLPALFHGGRWGFGQMPRYTGR